MKYIKQFAIILTISFLGEVIKSLIPLPIPASIYGLVLMLLVLCTGIISLESVKETAKFLIEIMPLMFIPAAVGLTESWSTIRPVLVPVVVITAVSTIVVMAVSGLVTQKVIRNDSMQEEAVSGKKVFAGNSRYSHGKNVTKKKM